MKTDSNFILILFWKLELESKRLSLIKDGKLCDISRNEELAWGCDESPDILNSLRLVPKFNEKEVETFFQFVWTHCRYKGLGWFRPSAYWQGALRRLFPHWTQVSLTIMPKLRLQYWRPMNWSLRLTASGLEIGKKVFLTFPVIW